MNGNNDFTIDTGKLNASKWIVKILGFMVYAAGAIFATLAFTNSIDAFFPSKDQPVMNLLAHIGAWANLFSVLLMIWAKDYWVTGAPMMTVAVMGWLIEVALMALNTLASFGSDWAVWFASLSPATPVFVIFLWGILWILHPDHKARQEAMAFQADLQRDYQQKLRRAQKSAQVQAIMNDGAALAAQQYVERTLNVVIDPTQKMKHPPVVPVKDENPLAQPVELMAQPTTSVNGTGKSNPTKRPQM